MQSVEENQLTSGANNWLYVINMRASDDLRPHPQLHHPTLITYNIHKET